jgi:hypothetical protein
MLIALSFVKVSSDIPLVSSCSIAISAACHRPQDDVDAHLLPITWGIVSLGTDVPTRCSFTTFKNVRSPIDGETISGQSLRCDVDWVEGPVSWTGRISRSFKNWFKGVVYKKWVRKIM